MRFGGKAMFGQRKREFLPWYRKPSYRGNLTEEQKRHLDAIRDRQPHPAATYDQLPEEVQSYIGELEMEAYDAKQQALVGRTVVLSAVGAFLVDANFLHLLNLTNAWAATLAVPLLVLPWLFYVRQWRRNADEFLPGQDAPSPTDEGLRSAWELAYIARRAREDDRPG